MKKLALVSLLAVALATHVDARPAKGAPVFDAFARICLQSTDTAQARAAVEALGGVPTPMPTASGLVAPAQPVIYDLKLAGSAARIDLEPSCRIGIADVKLPALLEAFDAHVAQRKDAEVLAPRWVHPVMRTERDVRLGAAGSDTATRLRVLAEGTESGRMQVMIERFTEKGSKDPSTMTLAEVPPSEDPAGRRAFPPRFPEAAVRACAFGTVRLRVTIDATGNVLNVAVDRSSRNRDLDVAARAAAMQWRYAPGLKDGQPIGGDIIVPVAFVNPCPGKKP
jgi:TonB family protein